MVEIDSAARSERGHLTDRYAKAIEQLGDDNDAVPLGGIYGLQQYAEDSAMRGDQRTVVEVLSAFIRDKLAGVGAATARTGHSAPTYSPQSNSARSTRFSTRRNVAADGRWEIRTLKVVMIAAGIEFPHTAQAIQVTRKC